MGWISLAMTDLPQNTPKEPTDFVLGGIYATFQLDPFVV